MSPAARNRAIKRGVKLQPVVDPFIRLDCERGHPAVVKDDGNVRSMCNVVEVHATGGVPCTARIARYSKLIAGQWVEVKRNT